MTAVHTLITTALILLSSISAAEIYKFQDAQGKWHFSDKKPETQPDAETVELSHNHKSKVHLEASIRRDDSSEKSGFWFDNPFIAPIQCFVDTPDGKKLDIRVGPESTSEIAADYDKWTRSEDFEYWCVLGDPDTEPSDAIYQVPFAGYKSLQVSQGFNGRFSHFEEPHVYAIDIAMPVGTPITAARDGIVVSTKDDYAYAGVTSAFFFDKANYVQILHEDGSYATYGHLLIGKILVKPGERVSAGDQIGYSGNTGFSTGPHLHFVIQYNNKGLEKSLPFKLQQSNGEIVTPERGVWLLPNTY